MTGTGAASPGRRSRGLPSPGFILLGFFLAASACGPVPEAGPQGLDLLSILPPETRMEDHHPASVKKKFWSLADGLPREWHPGPDGVVVERGTDGIRLSSPEPPWLEIRIGIDPLRYEKMKVVFAEGQGEGAELYYSYSKPPVYRLAGRVRSKPASPTAVHERLFLLPHPDGAEERLQAFRIYPCGRDGGMATIREISLVPRRGRFIEEAILSRDRIDLDQEFRRCWRIGGEGERRVTFRVLAEGAVLRFGTGTLLGGGESKLRLVASARGRDSEDLLAISFGPRDGGWTDHRVDLSSWAGETLTLRFQVESTRGSGAIRLIGSPVVRARDTSVRPNVVLVVVDTLRADRLSCYGHPDRISPHLDRLARQGLLFSQARAPSSWTIPSTAALLTGRYPLVPGVEKGAVPAVDPSATTLAELFSWQGYATGGFSANFVLDGFRGFARGFETWYLAPYQDAHITARELNHRALEWVRAQRDEPFFLYLQYMDPHEPYDAPTAELPLGRVAGPFDIQRGHRWQDGTIVPLIMGWERLSGVEEQARLEGYYHEEVAYVDRALGRLLSQLRAGGLLEQALVLVTADHGEELGDHHHWSHGYTLHREVLHVPLVLSAPGLDGRGGTVVRTPVSLVDASPTLADLAGLDPAPGSLDGRHLLDAISGRTMFASTSACGLPTRYAVFDGRYAYLRFDRDAAGDRPPGSAAAQWLIHADPPAEALYDLQADPLERENLARRLPEVRSRLSARLEAHFGHTGERDGSVPLDEADLQRLRALGYVQ
jgi:arylsulfatase A-like enzyme